MEGGEERKMDWHEEKITVCDKCNRACCWQGQFMCDSAQHAGTVQKTRAQLIAERADEHPRWWKTDAELADGKGEEI